jgi:hypothetical protein
VLRAARTVMARIDRDGAATGLMRRGSFTSIGLGGTNTGRTRARACERFIDAGAAIVLDGTANCDISSAAAAPPDIRRRMRDRTPCARA